MSRIYFHSVKATAEVSGRERALLGIYCSRALLFALGDLKTRGNKAPWILKHIPEDHYIHQLRVEDGYLIKDIETWLGVGYGENAVLLLEGKRHPLFSLQLNSALAMGGNPMKLAARLHGQCEIHCYVEGPNRDWLAGIIEDALGKHIFRPEQGWESVCEMLREDDDTPVVCSYSVCDTFPNRHVAEWEPEAGYEDGDGDGDGWYSLPPEKQWGMALAGLRKSGCGLELKPDGWDDFYVGSSPVSGFDFYNQHQAPDKATPENTLTPP